MRHNFRGSVSRLAKSLVVGLAALLLACLAVFSGVTFAAASPAVPLAESPPVAVQDEYTMAYNTVLTVPVATGILSNDTNLPANPNYSRIFDANHNAANSFSPDGSFSYTPDTDFVGDDSYTYCITPTFGDQQCLSNIVKILIHVIGPPPVPVAVADDYTITNGTTLNALILDNDKNRPVGSSFKVVTPLSYALFNEFSAEGHFSYVPSVGFVGVDSFTYCITALYGTGPCLGNTVTVTVTVQAPPPPPVAANDNYSTPVNTTLTVAAPGFLANDEYFNDFPGAFAFLTNFAHASDFDLNGDGSLKYVPVTGYVGVDTATYCLTEGSETSVCISNVVTITITVAAPVVTTTPPVATTPASAILATTGTDGLPMAQVGILLAIVGGLMLALANAGRRRRHS